MGNLDETAAKIQNRLQSVDHLIDELTEESYQRKEAKSFQTLLSKDSKKGQERYKLLNLEDNKKN